MSPIGGGELLLDRVAGALRAAILSGELAPGTHLSVPELARQLEVSRTPAREALFRLQSEGLVSVTPRRGAVVLSGDPGRLAELFEYREALEGMAARLAAKRMDADGRAALRASFEAHAEAVRTGDLAAHVEHDQEFHELFIAGSGNQRIEQELGRVRSQLTLLTRRMSAKPGALTEIVTAHEAILTGIEAGDGRRAENAARVHVRGIFDFYRENP
ncbi:GntR family transcriptional regulator [Actinocorallia sp. B10E7]|uniref:GntR family transcriptional regulator n=1 Tax=Actinocorallia sp. B10E7 TaxID=3153558 RepID=UPI00325EF007